MREPKEIAGRILAGHYTNEDAAELARAVYDAQSAERIAQGEDNERRTLNAERERWPWLKETNARAAEIEKKRARPRCEKCGQVLPGADRTEDSGLRTE